MEVLLLCNSFKAFNKFNQFKHLFCARYCTKHLKNILSLHPLVSLLNRVYCSVQEEEKQKAIAFLFFPKGEIWNSWEKPDLATSARNASDASCRITNSNCLMQPGDVLFLTQNIQWAVSLGMDRFSSSRDPSVGSFFLLPTALGVGLFLKITEWWLLYLGSVSFILKEKDKFCRSAFERLLPMSPRPELGHRPFQNLSLAVETKATLEMKKRRKG